MPFNKNENNKKNKKKKAKKDELRGAIDNETSTGSIMGDFVNNIKNDKNDKNNFESKSKKGGGLIDSIKSLTQSGKKDRGDFGGNLPMIRNPEQKEWWVSFGAFLTVILVVILLFIGFGSGNKYQLYLAPGAVDNYTYGSAQPQENFETGRPVYVYFAAKKAIKSNKIFIQVMNLNKSSSEGNLSSIESNINPNWKIVETHFQKEYFESPGKYKIIIQNEKKKVLIEKTFNVK